MEDARYCNVAWKAGAPGDQSVFGRLVKKRRRFMNPVISNPKSKKKLGGKVTFEYFAPAATTVEVAGTFNNWDPNRNPLKKDRKGRWKVVLNLPPGSYEYRYWVDGRTGRKTF